MKKKITDHRSSLSRKIFISFLIVVLFSVISLGFFWLDSNLTNYHRDVKMLKISYSDNKKLEIKTKILQIKDFIQWIRSSPNAAVSKSLPLLTESLLRPYAGKLKPGDPRGIFPSEFKDSLKAAGFILVLLDGPGKIAWYCNPFDPSGSKKPSDIETELISRLKKDGPGNGVGTAGGPFRVEALEGAVASSNDRLLPGFRVISIVTTPHVDPVIQAYILDSLSKLRYGENEYVFVNTISGKALISNGIYNKTPIDIPGAGNPAWMKVFNVEKTAVNHPEGVYFSYSWQKLSPADTSLKTSYFSYLPAWKWIIGTGFYEDDVDAFIELKRKSLFGELGKSMLQVLSYLFISSLLCYALVSIFSSRFRKNIELFTDFFDKAAGENLLIDPSQVNYLEFTFIAEAANRMVTDREKARDDLQKSEEKSLGLERRFRETLENIRLISILVDLDGKVSFCNDYLLELTGYSRGEVLGSNWFGLFVPENKQAGKELFLNGYHGGIITPFFETAIRKKNGEELIIRFNNTLLRDPDGNAIGMTSIGEDITDRKRAEDELIRHMEDLQRFHDLTVGRELTMIELKKEVNLLLKKAGEEEKYRIVE